MQSALELLLTRNDDGIAYVYVDHVGFTYNGRHYVLPSNTFCSSQSIANNIINILAYEEVFNHNNFNQLKIVDDSAYKAKEIKEYILKYSPYKAVEIYYDTAKK